MNNIPDYILDTALSDLRAGESVTAITARYPEYAADLTEALALAYSLQTISLNTPPAPAKRYTYAESAAQTTGVLGFINIFRYVAIPLVIAVAFVGSRGLINATEGSLPGQTLYSLKRAGEEARINFTFDDAKVATLQVELTQKRIEEAKQALSTDNPEQHAAALEELTKQTEKTFAAASKIASSNAINQNDTTLLDNLVAINEEQKSILASSRLEDKTEALALISKKNDTAIAKLIATVNEQTLVDLTSKPKEEQPAVKGAATSTNTTAPTTTTKPAETTNSTPTATTTPAEIAPETDLPQQPSRATAGFIVEPVESQYAP